MTKLLLPKLALDPVHTVRGPVRMRTPFRREFLEGFSDSDKDVPPEYIGDPIHLTASVTSMQPGNSGVGVNVKALRNPGPGMIEVWGLKFRLRSTQPVTGALVGCRLDLGDFPLTNGFIPVYAFGRSENIVGEQLVDGNNPPVSAYATYTARLSRPIVVPPGAAIVPKLEHRRLTSASVDVHVSLVGRMLPKDAPLPKQLLLPYWAAYVSKTFTFGAADTDSSTENDLANPFDVPLHMERFVGRIGYFSAQGALRYAATPTMVELETQRTVTGSLGDGLQSITCSIIDSSGYPVVKKLTPFRLVFDAETRSWPLTHDLPPGGYYLASLSSAVLASGAVANWFVQPCISMLGWREVG